MTKRNKDESAIEKAPGKGGVSQVVERNPMDVTTYRILNRSDEDIAKAMDIFRHNLRGQKLTERDLTRIKVPPQGITVWSIPSAEGDTHEKELTGILVEYTTPRAYWEKPMDPGSVAPPDCSSPDGMMGTGNPGGPCHLCPLSKFGSDPREDSNGQACKEKRMLFLLRPDGLMPAVVQAPSTSIRNVFDYAMDLANKETALEHVYTQMTLEKVATGGIEYGKVVLKTMGEVPEEFHSQTDSYRKGLANILSTQEVEIVPDAEVQSGPTGEHQPNGDDQESQDNGSEGNGADGEAGGNGNGGNGEEAGKEPETAGAQA